jgi:antitoxin Phd
MWLPPHSVRHVESLRALGRPHDWQKPSADRRRPWPHLLCHRTRCGTHVAPPASDPFGDRWLLRSLRRTLSRIWGQSRRRSIIFLLTSQTGQGKIERGDTMETSTWQLQDAKAHFSELVRTALTHGPQVITKHGQESVVVLSAAEYRQITQPKDSLVDFFLSSPRIELDVERDMNEGRDLDL